MKPPGAWVWPTEAIPLFLTLSPALPGFFMARPLAQAFRCSASRVCGRAVIL